jgi:hypothetical protein
MLSSLKNILFRGSYTYIFIDESICDESGLATLTSIFIPQNKLNKISTEFFKITKEIVDIFQATNVTKVLYPFPFLHGKSLLNDPKENPDFDLSIINDEFRLHVFNRVIDIVLKHKLLIARLGYNNYIEIKKSGFRDDKMYSTNWLNLSSFIDTNLTTKSAICVMDGADLKMINTFSRFISGTKSLIYLHGAEKATILKNGNRFINNVFYVPSKYSEHLQIVDIISYVLHKKDFIDTTGKITAYSKNIYELYPRLVTNRLFNKVRRLKLKSTNTKK